MSCFILLDLWMLLLIFKWKFQTGDFYKNMRWKEVRNKEKEGGKRKTIYKTNSITFVVSIHPYQSTHHFPTGWTVTVECVFILDILAMFTSARTGAMLCICTNDCVIKPIPISPTVPAMEIVNIWTDLKWRGLIPILLSLYRSNILHSKSQSPAS